jgi:hypothetical protein
VLRLPEHRVQLGACVRRDQKEAQLEQPSPRRSFGGAIFAAQAVEVLGKGALVLGQRVHVEAGGHGEEELLAKRVQPQQPSRVALCADREHVVERLAQREHEPLLREHREDAGGRPVVLLADERGRIHARAARVCVPA